MSEAETKASRPTTVFLARWRGGINFLCDAIRELGWRQGGMRECAQCDLYMAGPQLGLTLDRDDDFRNLREDQRCSRFPRMDWVTLKAPTTRLLHLLSQFYDDCSKSTVPVVTGAAADGDCDPAVSAGAEYAASQRSTPNPAWFYPQTFILPEQMRELKASLENSAQQRQQQ